MSRPRYLIGIDGGGTGTRARLALRDGTVLGQGRAGPSALGQGVESAWRQIERAVLDALHDAERHGDTSHRDLQPETRVGTPLTVAFRQRCVLALGLSGAENPGWVQAFKAMAPPCAEYLLLSDGEIGLAGAHAGKPGVIVSIGTGSVGVARHPDGRLVMAGGWGWQLGDEASGAWIGRHALQHAQHAMDGRAPCGLLSRAVLAHCGATRAALLDWCAAAGQAEIAALAPLVFSLEHQDPVAHAMIARAVTAVEHLITTLDPTGTLPLVMAGSLGLRLQPRLNLTLRYRCVPAAGDACDGALRLLRAHLATSPEVCA